MGNQLSAKVLLYFSALLLGVITGVCALAYLSASALYEYEDTVQGHQLPQVDVIVVLAGARGRIRAGADLWHQYYRKSNGYSNGRQGRAYRHSSSSVPVFYVAGMGPFADWNVLASQVRKRVLRDLHSSYVVLETDSTNTYENARWFARNALEKGWKRFLLVTSSYHMRRASYVFGQVLGEMTLHTYSIHQEPFTTELWSSNLYGVRVSLWEYLKWIYTRAFFRL